MAPSLDDSIGENPNGPGGISPIGIRRHFAWGGGWAAPLMNVQRFIVGMSLRLFILILCASTQATPPDYLTFKREQRIHHTPVSDELLRIWMVYVAQGDGLMIQLPARCNYDPDPEDDDTTKSERIDILIDGGSSPTGEAWRIGQFIEELYSGDPPIIEHAVISHHDQDHLAGLIELLEESEATFETIYHNGLASYKPGRRGFPRSERPAEPAVYKFRNRVLQRGMAFLDADGHLDDAYLIDDIRELREAFENDELHGTYEDLGNALLWRSEANELFAFQRAFVGAPFIAETESRRGTDLSRLQFETVWPLAKLEPYGGKDWGETINGNSLTFRLTYGDFQMVFAGDHNEESEQTLLEHLDGRNEQDRLNCDVLKVPHHGSDHAFSRFFKRDGFRPVVSVASMGDTGFRSKQMYSRNWQHPSTDVIRWLGGSHRVYHTFIHERRFKWINITTDAKRQAMIERTQILIETDGDWFRLVELPVDNADLHAPPSVTQTRRGNGTRWIRARESE